MDTFCCFNSQGSKYSSGKGRSNVRHAKYGFSLVKGKANHPMEDYHVAKFVQFQGRELGLFAIYDGHLGDSVPAYLQKHLFSNILKQEEFWVDPSRSIAKAYERTDQAIISHNPDLGRGGSTAVNAILIDCRRLWVANVGDSRAVLSRRRQAIQLSIDHEPNTERDDIENKGGFVSNIPGDVARVDGQLAVSRAFGDKNLKLHLRSDPDVTNADIDNETDLLILASDGLWKVMSNQEAVDVANKIKDPQKAAKQLATAALNRVLEMQDGRLQVFQMPETNRFRFRIRKILSSLVCVTIRCKLSYCYTRFKPFNCFSCRWIVNVFDRPL